MIKLSVVIITFNEEKNIERCLNSVREIADEIIVLDSFSTDKTEEICKKYNVKFFLHKFDGYTSQKNRAVTFAENDYVLSLDADEVLSEKLINSIKQIPENQPFDAYDFNRLNIYCGKPIKHTSWYPDKKIRLWNKNKGKWEGDKIHEIVKIKKNAETGFLKGDLLHFSYNSIEEHIAQANKFSTVRAEEYFNKNKSLLLLKAIFAPQYHFIRNYFIKFGFLEGYYGFIISCIIAFEVFLKYVKAFHLSRNKTFGS
ncbi:MAG: glycosyltransferase family 2 protein [Chlorobi bacterium]|nr:glycosyltransferase family 2 protein [Chlorobiota bacterium]